MRTYFYIFIFFVFLTSCAPSDELYSRQAFSMGVLNEVSIIHKDPNRAELLLEESISILNNLDQKLSHYKSDSELSQLNKRAFQSPQKTTKEIFYLTQESKELNRKTKGSFDISLLPLVKLWGFFDGEDNIPSQEEIDVVLESVGMSHVALNKASKEISFNRQNMEIEFGAIAKGYVCDEIVNYLKSEGVISGLVNIGGTIFGFGKNINGELWQVGIKHPRDSKKILKIISLDNEAVSTSGDYENYFFMDGKRFGHILNPKTGYPIESDVSVAVSVVAPSGLLSDVLSTSIYVLGVEEGKELLKQYKDISFSHSALLADGSIQSVWVE